jgi:hypothetical protein
MGDTKKRKTTLSQKKRFKKSVAHMLEARTLPKPESTPNENHVATSKSDKEVADLEKRPSSELENDCPKLIVESLISLLFPTGSLPNRSKNPNPNFRGQIQDWSSKRKADLVAYLREITFAIVEAIYPQDVISGLRLLLEDIRFSKRVGYIPSSIDYGLKKGMAKNTMMIEC